jgi:hypothetical protein
MVVARPGMFSLTRSDSSQIDSSDQNFSVSEIRVTFSIKNNLSFAAAILINLATVARST